MDAQVKPIPTHDELVARARALAPVLADRADATERNRSMLPETLRDLRDAGFFRIMQARGSGGYELGVPTLVEVGMEIARGSASDAWVLGLCSNQNRFIGCYPKEAQDEVYAHSGEDLVTCLVTGPTTTAVKVDGGYRLTGRWPYVSGVDQCTWLLLSAFDPDAGDGGARQSLTFLVPREALAEVIDDWHVLGLRGTGSKTVVLDDLFVPAYRALNFWLYDDRPPPGAAVNPGPLYQGVPRIAIFSMTVAAPAVGLALAAADALRDRLKARRSPLMAGSAADNVPMQIALGNAIDRANVMRDLLLAAAREFQAQAESGRSFTAEERLRYRLRAAEILRSGAEIVLDVFKASGTGAAFDSNPLQRLVRDALTVRSHVVVDYNSSAENVGRFALGLEPKPPFN
ncbi:MAG: hypothetical protein WD470_07070 [Rhodospirillaceae bacterium]